MAMSQSSTMMSRVLRAAMLESQVYEEAEHTPQLQSEAITVVVLVSAVTGIGQFLAMLGAQGIGNALLGLVGGFLLALVSFFIWAGIAYLVGTRLFGGTADYGEMIRTMGYAYGPQILGALVFIPFLGGLAGFIGGIWSLVASIVAIRQALDFSTGKAVLTVIVGWLVVVILSAIVGALVFAAGGMM